MGRLIDLLVWILTLGRRGRAPWRTTSAPAAGPAPGAAAARMDEPTAPDPPAGAPGGEESAAPSAVAATDGDSVAAGEPPAHGAAPDAGSARDTPADPGRAASTGAQPVLAATLDDADAREAAVPSAVSSPDGEDSAAAGEPTAQGAASNAGDAQGTRPGTDRAAFTGTEPVVAAGDGADAEAATVPSAVPATDLDDSVTPDEPPAHGAAPDATPVDTDAVDPHLASGADGAGPPAPPGVQPPAETTAAAGDGVTPVPATIDPAVAARPARRGFRVETATPPYQPPARERPAFAADPEFRASVHEAPDPGYALYLLPRAVEDIQLHLEWGARTRRNLVEQGGILLGQAYRDPRDGLTWAVVERAVAGVSAQGSPAFVQFDHRTWREMLDQVDGLPAGEDGPPRVIGWYHTHPGGLSVFMSGTDRATQRRMFYADWHFAMVLNPQRRYWRVFHGAECAECDGGAVRAILPAPALAAAPDTDAEARP